MFLHVTFGALVQHRGVLLASARVSQPLQHIGVVRYGFLVLPYNMLTLVGEDGLARQRSCARRVVGGLLGGLTRRASRGEAQHRHEIVVLVRLVGGTLERPQLLLAGGLTPERLRGVDHGLPADLLYREGGGRGRVVVGRHAPVKDVDGLLIVAGHRKAEEEEECRRGPKPHADVRVFFSLTAPVPIDRH